MKSKVQTQDLEQLRQQYLHEDIQEFATLLDIDYDEAARSINGQINEILFRNWLKKRIKKS